MLRLVCPCGLLAHRTNCYTTSEAVTLFMLAVEDQTYNKVLNRLSSFCRSYAEENKLDSKHNITQKIKNGTRIF
jgi:hypothetical protein